MVSRQVKGSVTVEAACIVPLFLGIFAFVVTLLFYYHDRCVVAAIAQETVATNTQIQNYREEDVKQYFQKRIRDKLLLFSEVRAEIKMETERIQIVCEGEKGKLRLHVEMQMSQTQPEEKLRDRRRWQQISKQIGEQE